MITNYNKRNRDFEHACNRARHHLYETAESISDKAVVDMALNGPAPEYYISYTRAEELLRAYRDNRLDEQTRVTTWLLAGELSARVNDLLANRRSRTISGALSMVLCQGGASRFFMTRSYARRCYYRMRRRRRAV